MKKISLLFCALIMSVSIYAQLVTSITLSPTTITTFPGETQQIIATIAPSDALNDSIVWVSSNTNIVQVDQNGLILGISSGTATITAESVDGGGATATAVVTVSNILVNSISISTAKDTITIGESIPIYTNILPANASNPNISWTSSNSNTITVNPNGVITGVNVGNSIITATAADGSGIYASRTITVINSIPATSISFPYSTESVMVGQTFQPTPIFTPTNATTGLIWTSSNPEIASITANGLITGLTTGTATITVSTTNQLTASFVLVVTEQTIIPVAGFNILENSLTLQPGQSFEISKSFYPIDATNQNVIWTSSNPASATIDSNGLVTYVNSGSTLITGFTEDGGFNDSLMVYCTSIGDIYITDIQFPQSSYTININDTIYLNPIIIPSNAANPALTYTVIPSILGTVSPMGSFISFGIEGTATIIAMSNDGTNITDSCVVHIVNSSNPTITLTPTSLTLTVNQTAIIQYITIPAGYPVTFTSNNPSGLTVNPNGVITAILPGTYVITSTISGSTATATCLVTVNPEYSMPTSISISQTNIQIPITAAGIRLSATVYPSSASNRIVTWHSGDTSIVRINQNGILQPVNMGETYVYASTTNGITSECTVIVSPITLPALESISSTQDTIFVQKNQTALINIIRYPSNAEYVPLAFEVMDSSITTVNSEGIITGLRAGTTLINVTGIDYPNITTTCIIKVLDETIQLQTLTSQIDTLEFTLGETNITEYTWQELFDYNGYFNLCYSGHTLNSYIADIAIRNNGFGIVPKNPGTTIAFIQAYSPTGITQMFEFKIIVNPAIQQTSNCGNLNITATITDINCAGENTGQVVVNATGGKAPYSYRWSNFRSDNKLVNVSAGTYYVTVTDSNFCTAIKFVTITEPEPITVNSTLENPSCGNSDGKISITINGGSSPYTIQWNTLSTATEISNLAANEYAVRVIDSKGCVSNSTYALQNANSPLLYINSIEPSTCNPNNGSIDIGTWGGTGVITYEWQDAIQTEDRTGLAPGNYTLTATDENNCVAIIRATVPSIPFNQPQISLVTVGESTGNNIIIWEKEYTNAIDFYTIYRESTPGIFERIDTVSYNSPSIFSDAAVNSSDYSYRYRISATDYCGMESAMSASIAEFKTINTVLSYDSQQNVVLNWDSYEGFNFTSYIIYKIVGNDTIEITRVPPYFNTYTYQISNGGASAFFVGVELPEILDPYGLLKSESGPFILAMSNIAEVENYIETIVNKTISVYPTIVENALTIDLGNYDGKTKVHIYSTNGLLVYQTEIESTKQIQIPVNRLSKGEYIVTITNDSNTISAPIIIK